MPSTKRLSLLSFLLFWYLTSLTQALILFSGGPVRGIRDATIIAFLWLIPVLLMPKHAKKLTAVIGIFLWLSALPGFGYYLIYGQELTQSLMFIIFESNPLETKEYLLNYISVGVILSFIVFTVVAVLIWLNIKPAPVAKKTAAIASLVILSFVFLTPVLKVVRHDVHKGYKSIERHFSAAPPWQLAFGYSHYQRELTSIEHNLLTLNQIPPLANLTEVPKSLPTTVVIVIGESTTRTHMSLYGYPRDTNPKLSSIKQNLVTFDNVFSSRPTTIESLEQVLTFANQQHPDDYKTTQSIINMMKQAGYKTYWITNQQTMTKRNTMLTTFAKQADEQVFLNNTREQNSYSFDEKVLVPFAEKLVNQDEKKLIIVHLLGTHMKYIYRYPEEYSYFKDNKGIQSALSADADKVQWVNEYDNAIRYNDHVLYELINTLKNTGEQQQSLLVYFSDHGEDVYETAPHDFKGRNEGKPTYPMYAVPFMVWHSNNWELADKLADPAIRNRQYDNADFIHTWSDLVGLTYDSYQDDESLVSKTFKEDEILVGNPYGNQLGVLEGTVKHKSHHAQLVKTVEPSVVTPVFD